MRGLIGLHIIKRQGEVSIRYLKSPELLQYESKVHELGERLRNEIQHDHSSLSLPVVQASDPQLDFIKEPYEFEEGKYKPVPEFPKLLDCMRSGKNALLLGRAGTGKTLMLQKLVNAMIELDFGHHNIAVTATSGFAASHIGGTTLDAFLGISKPYLHGEELIRHALSRSDTILRLLNANFLIVDECSLLSRIRLHDIDMLLREARYEPLKFFGGLQVLFVGDFLQLMPFCAQGSEVDFVFQHPQFHIMFPMCFELQTVHRHDDQVLERIVEHVRYNKLTVQDMKDLDDCWVGCKLAIDRSASYLFSRRWDVRVMNHRALKCIRSELHTFVSNSVGVPSPDHCVPAIRDLKVGARVKLLANQDVAGSLVNGTTGVCESIAFVRLQDTVQENSRKTPRIVVLPRMKYKDRSGASRSAVSLFLEM